MIFIDPDKKALIHNRFEVFLSDKEYLFFDYLLKNRHKGTVPAESLISYVWRGKESTITQNNLSQLAYRVKLRIESTGVAVEINTSIKNGCKLTFRNNKAVIINKFPFLFKFLKKLICR